jgi:hypothetical protein
MQTNENLIISAIEDNWINALCFYYKAKKVHTNSCFYNYSIRSLAAKTHTSFYTVRNYINELQKQGLAKIQGKHLLLVSQTEANKTANERTVKHLCTLKITKETPISEIKKLLYAKIVEMQGRQQKYIVRLKEEARLLNKPFARITVKQIKRIHEAIRTNPTLETPLNENVTMSDKYLSSKLYCSTKTISNYKKYWSNIMEIKHEKAQFLFRISKDAFNCSNDILKNQYGEIFFYKGCLFKSSSTYYKIK